MSLAAIAAADLRSIINADGDSVTVLSPDGRVAEFKANTQDISHAIDPQTGMLISGRTATVALSSIDLLAAAMAPKGESDGSKKPWVVRFLETVSGVEHSFKVKESRPDRTIGALVLILEIFK